MLREVLDLAEGALAQSSPDQCADEFYDKLKSRGVGYFQARHYRLPSSLLTSRNHWDAGGFVARHDPRHWIGRVSSQYVCFTCNPLLEPVALRMSRFRFSEFAPRDDRRFTDYWDAMAEGGVGEGLAAMAYGANRSAAAIHIGFADARDARSIDRPASLAAMVVAERIVSFDLPDDDTPLPLTGREIETMRFVAEGKTDWEIGQIIGVSENTARFHVDNARRKLDASNRAHAVAKFLSLYGLF